jgi:hypothetical protein
MCIVAIEEFFGFGCVVSFKVFFCYVCMCVEATVVNVNIGAHNKCDLVLLFQMWALIL